MLELDKHQVIIIENEILTVCKKKNNICKFFTFVQFHIWSNVGVTTAIQPKKYL